MKILKIENNWLALIILATTIMVSVITYKFYRYEKLKDSDFTLGVLFKVQEGTSKSGPTGIFNYTVNGEPFKLVEYGNYKESEIGSFFCIEYSKDDFSIARISKLRKCKK